MPITAPTDIANCEVWFHRGDWYTDAGSTLAANGQSVQQWNDSSGHGRHATQATGTKKPTRNNAQYLGLDGLRFANGSAQELAFDGSWMYNGPVTIFIVSKLASQPGTFYYLGSANAGTTGGSLHTGYRSDGQLTLALWGNDWNQAVLNFASTQSAWRDCLRWGGPGSGALSRDMSRNGAVLQTSTTDTSKLNSLANATASRIGQAVGNYFNGWIYEVVGYSRVLTAAEYSDLDAWAVAQGYVQLPSTARLTAIAAAVTANDVATPIPKARFTATAAAVTALDVPTPVPKARLTALQATVVALDFGSPPLTGSRISGMAASVLSVDVANPPTGSAYSYAMVIS